MNALESFLKILPICAMPATSGRPPPRNPPSAVDRRLSGLSGELPPTAWSMGLLGLQRIGNFIKTRAVKRCVRRR